MTDTEKNFKELEAKILQACAGKAYLFRGTTQRHSKDGETEINSSLYRWAVEKEVVFHEKYHPFDMEEEIVQKAKKHFPDKTSNIEILTDLQHYGGKTNLIDFSKSLYTALFFACDGNFTDDGELICLERPIEKEKDIKYKKLQEASSPFIIEPAGTQTSQRRVIAQDSVFVYAREGFLDQDRLKIIPVPHGLKAGILEHLEEFHHIDTHAIYNDLMGFITNEENYETAAIYFYQGFAQYEQGNYEAAIDRYDEAIQLNPKRAEIYNARGGAKTALGQHEEAINDFDEAIRLNKKAEAYNNQSAAKYVLRQYPKAINDFDKAIRINPDAVVYCNRGLSKAELEQYEEAIKDMETAKGLFESAGKMTIVEELERQIQSYKDRPNKS